GAIVGALAAGLLLIPWFGTQGAQRLLIGLSLAGGFLMLGPHLVAPATASSGRRHLSNALRVAGLLVLALGAAGSAAALTWSVPATPWELIAFGRSLPSYAGGWTNLYV